MEQSSDVLIVGGGLNGPVLALALASAGLSSLVIDAAAGEKLRSPRFDGRAYALSLSSVRMFEALGLWAACRPDAQVINRIKISDGVAGEGASPHLLQFDGAEIDDGPMGYILEDRFLRAVLLDRIADNELIGHLGGTRVVAQQVSPGTVSVTTEDGGRYTAPLLVGCDGRGSAVARRAGIGRTGRDYRQMSLVCSVDHEHPHEGTAHQFFMPSGPLAILPLPGNCSSIVWTENRAVAERLSALGDEEFMAVLRPRFGDFLGSIELAGDRFCYPLSLSLAESFTAERVALAGDAAHGIHPLAGQGLNLGLRDVAALAEVVAGAASRGQDVGSLGVMEQYQRWRRVDTGLLAVATDGVNRLFSNGNPFLRAVRGVGLDLFGRWPAARRRMIQEAAGVSGDLPRLLRGQGL